MTYEIIMNSIYNLSPIPFVLLSILGTVETMLCFVFILIIPRKAPYKAYRAKKRLLTSNLLLPSFTEKLASLV